MTSKTLRTLTAIIAVVLALVVGWSIIAGNFFVPIIAVVLAIGLSYLLRRRTKEVTKDERTALLYEKAAGATIRFCVPLVAVVGIILFALRDRLSPEMGAVGYVLAYVACGLLIVHSAFYSYYSRKH
jgi:putative transcriptional regulator